VYACQDYSTTASGALLVPYVMGQALQGQYYSSAPTRSDALRVMQNQTVNYWRPCNTVDFYRYCVFFNFFRSMIEVKYYYCEVKAKIIVRFKI